MSIWLIWWKKASKGVVSKKSKKEVHEEWCSWRDSRKKGREPHPQSEKVRAENKDDSTEYHLHRKNVPESV